MATREQIEAKYVDQLNALSDQIDTHKKAIANLQAKKDAIDERKSRELDRAEDTNESLQGEDASAAVNTGSLGVATATTNDGATIDAPFGSSYIYAPKMGMVSRKGDVKSKKKKKKSKNFYKSYFEME
jgi:hypothetical protein